MLIKAEQLKILLVGANLVATEKFDAAEAQAEKTNQELTEVLVDQGLISDTHLAQILANYLKIPFVDLSQIEISRQALNIIPEIVAKKQRVIAFALDQAGLKLGMVDPSNTELQAFIAKKSGVAVIPYLVTPRAVETSLKLYQKELQASFDEMIKASVDEAGKSGAAEAPIAKIVDLLIEYAHHNRASDVHIEPEKDQSIIRFRIDGVLHDVLTIPKAIHEQVISRIKVAAKLKTDEHFSAQDGKMQVVLTDEDLDVRVSLVPITKGEKAVLRLLSSKSRQMTLTDLGMKERDLAEVQKAFSKSYGMILSTGPTGSGKTTSIYAILKLLNTRDVNIASIEDPVEYDIQGINQIQVNVKTNLTFANGLRSILRQDPNVIFVGEIRDSETADIAVNSAMTGHLVLSTLHTNDAATTLPRLMDMGIEPYLAASTVSVIIGQRLVRKVCEKCRASTTQNTEALSKVLSKELIKTYFGDKPEFRIYKGKGCPVCNNTGYTGRIGIFEVLVVSEEIKELIVAKTDAGIIRQKAIEQGMTTMLQDGLAKVAEGLTTIDEVLRATKE